MNITWYLVIGFLVLLRDTNKKYGVINDKIQYINYFLSLLLLVLAGYSVDSIIWVVAHFDNILQYFKNYEYMPQWLNIIMWIALQVADLISILIVYYIVQRREKARLYLIKILPILAITLLYDSIKQSYELLASTSAPLNIIIGIFFIVSILPYMIIYYFYSRENIKNKLFIN